MADCCRNEETGKQLAAVRCGVFANLRCAVALDIEAYMREGGDRSAPALTWHNGSSKQGFVISRSNDSSGTRTLAVDLKAASLTCRYDECERHVGTASHQRGITIDIGNDAALSMWDAGLARRFTTVEALSAFLLAPILATTLTPDSTVVETTPHA